MEVKETATSILMLPWLAQGHISPFLELAKKLSDRNFNIYICSTSILLQSIEKKITQKYANSIALLPYNIPPSPELPLHSHTTNGLAPHLMMTLKNEYEKASPQFSTILTKLRPDLVIYDFNQPWAVEIAVSQNIPAVQFIVAEIYLREYEKKKRQDRAESLGDDMQKDTKRFVGAVKNSCSILLVKSCREIEDKFMEILEKLWEKKVLPVGQLVEDSGEEEQSEIIQWLDKKQISSVLFVSFGSEYFLTKEDIFTIAKGLELSNVNFIWVIRFPAGEKIAIEEALPNGFLEKIKDRGLVIEGWAPQTRILKHSSTGGFLSHGGWSSVMETMKFGVPMVVMPMHLDQPLNARFVVAVGVGVEAIRDDEGKLHSMEIAKVIRQVVVDESGEEVRKKVKEVSNKLKMKGDEEIDTLVEEIKGLCKNFSKQSSAGV